MATRAVSNQSRRHLWHRMYAGHSPAISRKIIWRFLRILAQRPTPCPSRFNGLPQHKARACFDLVSYCMLHVCWAGSGPALHVPVQTAWIGTANMDKGPSTILNCIEHVKRVSSRLSRQLTASPASSLSSESDGRFRNWRLGLALLRHLCLRTFCSLRSGSKKKKASCFQAKLGPGAWADLALLAEDSTHTTC